MDELLDIPIVEEETFFCNPFDYSELQDDLKQMLIDVLNISEKDKVFKVLRFDLIKLINKAIGKDLLKTKSAIVEKYFIANQFSWVENEILFSINYKCSYNKSDIEYIETNIIKINNLFKSLDLEATIKYEFKKSEIELIITIISSLKYLKLINRNNKYYFILNDNMIMVETTDKIIDNIRNYHYDNNNHEYEYLILNYRFRYKEDNPYLKGNI